MSLESEFHAVSSSIRLSECQRLFSTFLPLSHFTLEFGSSANRHVAVLRYSHSPTFGFILAYDINLLYSNLVAFSEVFSPGYHDVEGLIAFLDRALISHCH
jgi:hypothetical protein